VERITVKASVICPTHRQLIGYMEARNWHMVSRREHNNGLVYSQWELNEKHYVVDIHESPEFPDYYLKQRDTVALLTAYDNWQDEYSLVVQLLRGGITGQTPKGSQRDKKPPHFSDNGAGDNSAPSHAEGKWHALDPTPRAHPIIQAITVVGFKSKGTRHAPCPFL
jgi:hypothetical protein